MSIDNCGGDIDQLEIVLPTVIAKHLKGTLFIDQMAFHKDALGALG